jgi:sensor histidine kinase YesM
VITYTLYSPGFLVLAFAYFIAATLITWSTCHWMHRHVRDLFPVVNKPAGRILAVITANALTGSCLACLAVLGWMQFSAEEFSWNAVARFVLACCMAIVLLTLLYEILFLTKERALDKRRFSLLDRERWQAELLALRNEMDPHFLFNSLNALNHLILHDQAQAHVFNNKLAQVYKYFLVNREKELIPLTQELDFINDYFFLLKIRHGKKMHLDIQLDIDWPGSVRIPPCSLQVLVENAIKHNAFSEEEPLHILIRVSGQYIKVVNRIRPKPYIMDSTHVGLHNLSSRYKLLFNRDIVVDPGREEFVVNLPVIR